MFVIIELPDPKDVTVLLDPNGQLVFNTKAGPKKAVQSLQYLTDSLFNGVARHPTI